MRKVLGRIHGSCFRTRFLRIRAFRFEAGQIELLRMLRIEFRTLDGRPHQLPKLRRNGGALFLELPAKRAKRYHHLRLPVRNPVQIPLELRPTEPTAVLLSNPQAKEDQIDVGTLVVLQGQTGFGDARHGIDTYREIPERIFRKRQISGPMDACRVLCRRQQRSNTKLCYSNRDSSLLV